MQALANYLVKNKKTVLEKWQEEVKKNGREEHTLTLIHLSRKEFYDHIPLFLDLLIENIRNEKTSKRSIGRKHGLQRWKHGVGLSEVVHEWGALHRVLARQINRSQNTSLISTGILTHAQELLAESIHKEIGVAVDQYLSLQRRQATIRVEDLEAAVRKQESKAMRRGAHLQQASHDLKGSMFAVTMGFQLLKGMAFGDDVARRIERMSAAADNISDLLNDLLDLSRLEAGEEELEVSRFDAAKVLRSLSDSLQPVAKARELELRTKGKDSLQVYGDRLKVKRIAQNLLLNALEYTSSGYVEISWKTDPPDHWVLYIRDTGPGLTTIHSDFPEFTAPHQDRDSDEPQVHGEGVGLLIVRQLCRLMDATMEVESSPDKGTLFRITLPADYSE